MLEKLGSEQYLSEAAVDAYYRVASQFPVNITIDRLSSENKTDLGIIFSAWKESKDQTDELRLGISDRGNYNDEILDERFIRQDEYLDRFFGGLTNKPNPKLILETLRDPEITAREVLIPYLLNQVYGAWVTSPETYYYASLEDQISPILTAAVPLLLENGDLATPRLILEHYKSIHDEVTPRELLLLEDLPETDRRTLLVHYINTFGFIKAVDTLSTALKNEDLPVELRQNLKTLYDEIEGEQVQAVMASLDEVYSHVEFSKYALNNKELTDFEVGLIERVSHQNDRIADLGAGAGRHTLALLRAGYTDVTACDTFPDHLKLIKEEAATEGLDEVKVAAMSWHQLGFEADSLDMVYCLGRSALHNRTGSDWASFMNESWRVLKDDGYLLLDVPDMADGVYNDNEAHLREHARNLGLDSSESMRLFDGPDQLHKFNRMALTDTQIHEYAELFGFTVEAMEKHRLGDHGEITNVYYTLQKDPNFDPGKMNRWELQDALAHMGLLDSGVDYNQNIKSWRGTLGQALALGPYTLDHAKPEMLGPCLAHVTAYGTELTTEYAGAYYTTLLDPMPGQRGHA
ncbi:MAG: class I SAM-dependent methyltransferase [candidate division WWE3 bacterium]|nr:class I SAM-dependent methyltransferase [candidate division WWE3 bacterium]